jgi:hypothetical protein
MDTIFIGDIDEYFCEPVDGNERWAVWISGKNAKLLCRFHTYAQAVAYRNRYIQNYPSVSLPEGE